MKRMITLKTVEQCFEKAKGEVDLDEYVRPFLARLVPSHYTFNVELHLLNSLASMRGSKHTQKKSDPLNAVPEPEALSSDHLHVFSEFPVLVPPPH